MLLKLCFWFRQILPYQKHGRRACLKQWILSYEVLVILSINAILKNTYLLGNFQLSDKIIFIDNQILSTYYFLLEPNIVFKRPVLAIIINEISCIKSIAYITKNKLITSRGNYLRNPLRVAGQEN